MTNEHLASFTESVISVMMKLMSDEDRVKFLYSLERNFCRSCGSTAGTYACYCQMDG